MDEELKTILITSLVLSFIFSFSDRNLIVNVQQFFFKLLRFFILSLLAMHIHKWTQKYYANRVGAIASISLWKSKSKFKFLNLKVFDFPLGIVIPTLISLLSRGQIFFTATTTTDIKVNPMYRIGKKYIKLTEYEYAKIAAISPITHIVIAVIANTFSVSLLKDFALVNTMIAISTMVPLPGLLGITILFGSKPLYILSSVFILISALLLKFLTGISTLIIAGILAVTTLVIYLWKVHTK